MLHFDLVYCMWLKIVFVMIFEWFMNDIDLNLNWIEDLLDCLLLLTSVESEKSI